MSLSPEGHELSFPDDSPEQTDVNISDQQDASSAASSTALVWKEVDTDHSNTTLNSSAISKESQEFDSPNSKPPELIKTELISDLLPLPTLDSFKASLKEIEKVKNGSLMASTASSRGRSRDRVTTHNSAEYLLGPSDTRRSFSSPGKRNSSHARQSSSPTGGVLHMSAISDYVSPTDKKLNKMKRVLVDSYQTLLSQVDYYEKQVITNKSSSDHIKRSTSVTKPRSSSTGRLSSTRVNKHSTPTKGPFDPNAPNTFTIYSGPSQFDENKRSASVPRDMKEGKVQPRIAAAVYNNDVVHTPNKEFTPVSSKHRNVSSGGGSRLPPPTPPPQPIPRSSTPPTFKPHQPTASAVRERSKSPSGDGRTQPSSSHGLFNRLHNTGTANRNATPTTRATVTASQQTPNLRLSLEGTTPIKFLGTVHSPTASSAIKTRGASPPRSTTPGDTSFSLSKSPATTKPTTFSSTGRDLLTPATKKASSTPAISSTTTPTSAGLKEKSLSLLALASSKPLPCNPKAKQLPVFSAAKSPSSSSFNSNSNKSTAPSTTQNKTNTPITASRTKEAITPKVVITPSSSSNSRNVTPSASSRSTTPAKTSTKRSVTPTVSKKLTVSSNSTPTANSKVLTAKKPSPPTTVPVGKISTPQQPATTAISAEELFKCMGMPYTSNLSIQVEAVSTKDTLNSTNQSNSPKPTTMISAITKSSPSNSSEPKNVLVSSPASSPSFNPPTLVRTKSNDSTNSTGSTGAVRSIRGGRPSMVSTPSLDTVDVLEKTEARSISKETSLKGIFATLDAEVGKEDFITSIPPTPSPLNNAHIRNRTESTDDAPQDSPLHTINKALLMYNTLDSVFSDTSGVIVSNNNASDTFMDSMSFQGGEEESY